jgi:phenylacetate-coenzyme A ligase PaaK-like adenylate-forming protein
MAEYFDDLETRDPAVREAALFAALPAAITGALRAPGWRAHLGAIDPSTITNPEALARLPVLRKADLPELQRQAPPFGDFIADPPGSFGHLFTSPGPIFEPEGHGPDPWRAARGFFAAGFRRGDIVLNTFSYHLTPGGLAADAGARAAGCAVIPGGPGNTEQQLELVAAYQPSGYVGTPDFLNILLEAADRRGQSVSCFRKALVSAAAFPRSLRERFSSRGIAAYEAYGTADIGFIAFETEAREGMVVNEDMIVEIVRPGTGEPVPDGEAGEVVVTTLDPRHPMIRLAVGDLSAFLPGISACGRTNRRIRGWMGRADQTAKIRGMFVRPEQVAETIRRYPSIQRARLVVTREGEADAMILRAETTSADPDLSPALAATLQSVTKLRGEIELVEPGTLPKDGKVIADERPVG